MRINRKKLRRLLMAAPFDGRGQSPILSNVLFGNGKATVTNKATTTTLEGMEMEPYSLDNIAQGPITLPIQALRQLIQTSKTEEVEILPAGECAHYGEAGFWASVDGIRLAGLDPEDFPKIKAHKGARKAKNPGDLLGKMIDLLPYCSQDINKRVLNGVLLDPLGQAVATDGHRLGLCVTGFEVPKTIVPAEAIRAAKRLFGGTKAKPFKTLESIRAGGTEKVEDIEERRTIYPCDSGYAEHEGEIVEEREGCYGSGVHKQYWAVTGTRLVCSDPVAVFYGDGFTITTKGLEGTFPEYQKVIPPTTRFCAVGDLGRAVELMAPARALASDKYVGIRLEGNGTLRAFFNNPGIGDWSADLDVPFENPDGEEGWKVSFNLRYLEETAKFIGDGCRLELNESTGPAVCRGKADDRLAIVMPMMTG